MVSKYAWFPLVPMFVQTMAYGPLDGKDSVLSRTMKLDIVAWHP